MADATVSSAGLRIVKFLVGNPPLTISDLIKATGVTRTAVTEQLNELVSAGFVEQNAERLSGRGRPRHLYKATEAALMLLFSCNQRMVVPAIWRSIGEIGGEALTTKVLKRVSAILAGHYNAKVTAKQPEDRLRQLMQLLVDEGGILEAKEENGQLVVYKRSCPFISMIDENHTICNIDLEMINQVVGSPVRRIACRHDGDPCCKVEIVK
jgi:predicted ArsR family transcriptional regulator